MSVITDLNLNLKVLEAKSNDLGTSTLPHILSLVKTYTSGVAINKFDTVYSAQDTATAAAATYDVIGGLTSVLTGAAINFVELNGIIVKNLSTTAADTLTIGGGANSVIDAQQPLGPGGIFVWLDPIDGITPVAATGDILSIDPGAKTISFQLILLGRSA